MDTSCSEDKGIDTGSTNSICPEEIVKTADHNANEGIKNQTESSSRKLNLYEKNVENLEYSNNKILNVSRNQLKNTSNRHHNSGFTSLNDASQSHSSLMSNASKNGWRSQAYRSNAKHYDNNNTFQPSSKTSYREHFKGNDSHRGFFRNYPLVNSGRLNQNNYYQKNDFPGVRLNSRINYGKKYSYENESKKYPNAGFNTLNVYWPTLSSDKRKIPVTRKTQHVNYNGKIGNRAENNNTFDDSISGNVNKASNISDEILERTESIPDSTLEVAPLANQKESSESSVESSNELSCEVSAEDSINRGKLSKAVTSLSDVENNLNKNGHTSEVDNRHNEIKITHDHASNRNSKSVKTTPKSKNDHIHNNKRKTNPIYYSIDLNVTKSFDCQALDMISQFEMTSLERDEVDQLVDDLVWIFSPIIPNVRAVLFGSVVAGTAFKNSDVDVYLECYSGLPTECEKTFIIKNGYAIKKGGFFKDCTKIPNARVPILKAVHVTSGLNVDVSFKTDPSEPHYGLLNNYLVKHLCSHDPRVRQLIMLILFWAKYHNLIGSYQISSFTFILMVIFYLQVVEILPPLHRIIKVNEDDTRWPTSFDDSAHHLSNSNEESLESLYLGFFSFYSAVRFNEVVISVLAGELVLRVLFDTPELLPECYSTYKKLVAAKNELPLPKSEMCVQEPFNLSLNTVKRATTPVIDMLKNTFLNVTNIFTKLSSERVLPLIHSQLQTIDDEKDSYVWQLPCPPNITSDDWFNKVLQATYTVFSDILLMKRREPYIMMCKFNLIGSTDANPVQFRLFSDYLVTNTKKRNSFLTAYNSVNISEFEKEIKASSLYQHELKKKSKKSSFYVAISIVKNEKNGSTEICVNKDFRQGKRNRQDHRQFISFLRMENFIHFLTLVLDRDSSIDKASL